MINMYKNLKLEQANTRLLHKNQFVEAMFWPIGQIIPFVTEVFPMYLEKKNNSVPLSSFISLKC